MDVRYVLVIGGLTALSVGCEKAAVEAPEAAVEFVGPIEPAEPADVVEIGDPLEPLVYVAPLPRVGSRIRVGSHSNDVVAGIRDDSLSLEDRFACDVPDEIEAQIQQLNAELNELRIRFREPYPSIQRIKDLLRGLEQRALADCVEAAQEQVFR